MSVDLKTSLEGLSVSLVELVVCRGVRGDGTPQSPRRAVVQCWTREGELIAEYDPGDRQWPVEGLGQRLIDRAREIEALQAQVAAARTTPTQEPRHAA